MMRASRNAFVTCSDTWMGVYAARALLQSGKYSKVNAAVFSKRSEFAKTLQREGATLMEWDVNNVESLTNLMRENDCCVMIPVPNLSLQKETENILLACERSDIKDCILWSAMEVDLQSSPSSDQPINRGKEIARMLRAVEQKFLHSSIANKVIFRLSLSVQSLFFLSDLVQDRASLPLATGSGSYAPVNLVDVGNATAKLLASSDFPPMYRGQTFTMTGNQLINSETLAEYASRALGSKISYQSLTISEFNELLERLVSIGEMTEFAKDVLVYKNYCIRENKLAIRTDDLRKFLEAEPTSIEKFFEENSQAFKPGRTEPTKVEVKMLWELKR